MKNLVETLAVEWGPYGIRINGLVPGLFPHEDMSGDIRDGLDRAGPGAAASPGTKAGAAASPGAGAGHAARQPALRVGEPRELGWAATFLASPYARFITGHTLVVDGANWQRRSLVNPDVVPVREQLGRGPFTG
ncbi:SDR family oxidoreductase [Streptomyces cirratus]